MLLLLLSFHTKFGPDDEDAHHILCGYIAGNADCMTWKHFLETHLGWIRSKSNPTGIYKKDNISRNFCKVLRHYQGHLAGDTDANYPKGVLKSVGTKGLRKCNSNNPDFQPGSAGLSFSSLSSFGSSNSNSSSASSLPTQIERPPKVINMDTDGVGHKKVINSIIKDLITKTSNLSMDDQVFNTKNFYNEGCKLRGGFKTEVNHAQGLIVFLPATADINT